MLEKEYGYKEAHFDFIQQYLRRICLQYGAALMYTSAKKEKNCDALLQYLRHKLYAFDFNVKPQLVEKDTILVPAGADSITKIQVDFGNQNLTKDADEPYEEIIRVPKRLQQRAAEAIAPLTVAEDDQDFLAKHKDAIEKEVDTKPADKGKTALPDLLGKLQGSQIPTPEPSPRLPQMPSVSIPDKQPFPGVTPLPTQSGVTPDKEHQVLADFFNSLIHKDRPPAATAGRKPASELAKGLNIPPRNPGAAAPSFNNREDVAKQLERIKNKYQKDT